MRVAALDLGTNTFLLLIAEVENGEIQQVLHDEVRVIRLGQGVHEARRFHPDALTRAEEAFTAYAQVIQRLKPERTLACATSAARDVSNQAELFEIASRAGIPLEVISGEREAELTFSGTIRSTPETQSSGRLDFAESQIVIDVGGGSTEFIVGNAAGIQARKSFDIGAVRLTEALVSAHPIPQVDLDRLSKRISEQLLDLSRVLQLENSIADAASEANSSSRPPFNRHGSGNIIAVAGTPTTLAALDLQQSFNAEKIDGYVLTRVRIQEWIDRLAPMTVEQRCRLAGMEPKRADVIVAGAMILEAACAALNVSELEVSIRGLRYGIAKSLA